MNWNYRLRSRAWITYGLSGCLGRAMARCLGRACLRWFTKLAVLRRWSRCYAYSLLLCGLFYEAICLCLTLWYFVLVFVSPFSIAITSLGEERANFSAFRTFVRFVLVWICRFPLPLGVWEGLRFVIMALPGLFSYLFCDCGAFWTFLLPFFLVGTRSESIVDPQRTIDPVK